MRKKMSKAKEENKQTVTIKRLVWYFSSCWKLMCTVKTKDKNKMNFQTFNLF